MLGDSVQMMSSRPEIARENGRSTERLRPEEDDVEIESSAARLIIDVRRADAGWAIVVGVYLGRKYGQGSIERIRLKAFGNVVAPPCVASELLRTRRMRFSQAAGLHVREAVATYSRFGDDRLKPLRQRI